MRRGIAVVPEGRRLFPDLSVAENLTVGGYARPAAAATQNRQKVFELFPRLAEPCFLMIDELSLGLMPKMVDLCYQAVGRLKAEGMTILLVEQSTARALDVADRVCVLESGRSVWQGAAAEARKDPAMIEAYLGITEAPP